MSGHAASTAAAVRGVLRNRSIRRIEIAWTTGTAADWALLVILLVIVYDAGGAPAAGILGAVRVVPGIVAGPFATTLVERYRGDRVLTAINAVRAVAAVATAFVVATELPLELTYVLAAVVAARIAGGPIQSALLPAFARTPAELVAANVASSTGEGDRHLHRSAHRRLAGRRDRIRRRQPARVAAAFAGAAVTPVSASRARPTRAAGSASTGRLASD